MLLVVKLDLGYNEILRRKETQEYIIDFPFVPRMWFLPDRIIVTINVILGTYALLVDSPMKDGVIQKVHRDLGITKVFIWDESLIEEPEFYEYRLAYPHPDQPFCSEEGHMLDPGFDTIQGYYLQNNPEASRCYSTNMISYCGLEEEIKGQPQIIEDKYYESEGDDWSYFAPAFEGDALLLCDEDRTYTVCDADIIRDLEEDKPDYKNFNESFFHNAYYYGNKSQIPQNKRSSTPHSPPPTPQESVSCMSTEDMSPQRMDLDA